MKAANDKKQAAASGKNFTHIQYSEQSTQMS